MHRRPKGHFSAVLWEIAAAAASIYTTFVSGRLFGQIGQDVGGAKEKAFDEPAM